MITLHNRAAPLALAALLVAAPLAAQPTVRLPAADRPLAGRATPVFTIGAEEGQSWEMLSTVSELAFDRNDNLYVLDRGNERVLVFDRNGRFVRQLGKEGDGPGEFRMPIGLAVLSNGGVAVADLAHRNVSLFGADGAFQRTSPWPENSAPSLFGIRAHPAGGIVTVLRPRLDGETIRSGVIPQTQVFSRLPLTANGDVSRLFEISDVPLNVNASGGANDRRVMFRSTARQFGPLTVWGVLPDGGTALSHTSLYTVKIQDANGRTVRFLQRPVAVRRPTEADKARARERQRENMKSGRGTIRITVGGPGGGGGGPAGRGGGMSEQEIERQLAEMQFADTVRVIQGLTVAPTGTIWIERTPRDIFDPGPIDVVTAAGEYRGTITGYRLPRAISASGRAAYVQTDDSGVERVVVHQLPRNWLN